MLMTCPKCGQLTKGQTGDQCPKCKMFLRPAAEMGELQQRRERWEDEPHVGAEGDTVTRKCPKCGAVDSAKEAKFCSRCGSPLPAQNKVETTAKKNKTSDLIAGYVFLGIIGFAIVTALFSYGVDRYQDYKFEKEMEEWREANPYTTDDIYDDIEDDDDSDYTYTGGTYHYGGSTDISDDYKLALFTLAEERVKDQLKSPSSARFPINYLGDEVQYERNGDCYTIASWVEAENSYGATIREQFMLSTTISGGKMKDIICIVG